MADYRIYCMSRSGVIGLAQWISEASDEDAIAAARRLRPDAQQCEVWLKERLVAKLNDQGQFERGDA